ncbi:MAG: cell wall-binding repeat-containing protein, partial [Microcella sp.]|nr:cell wall-binding repeat-containing protein [Microcella sp.]
TVAEALASTLSDDGIILRLAGTSRFDTARVINDFAFASTETYPDFAFIANGLGFADALTGGPLASRFGAPMFLSTQRCLDVDVFIDLLDLLVVEAYALGSPIALSDRVLYGDFC